MSSNTLLSCKKDSNGEIKLYDKSPSEIKKYISGRWEFEWGIEGFSQQRVDFDPGRIMEFKFREIDSVFVYFRDTLVTRSAIWWTVIPNFFAEGNLTVMESAIFPFLSVDGIKNDTLCLFVPASDGNVYCLTKSE